MNRKFIVLLLVAGGAISAAVLGVVFLGSSAPVYCATRTDLQQQLVEAVSNASRCTSDSECMRRFGPVDVPQICNMCINRNSLDVVEKSEKAYLQGCFMVGNCVVGGSECLCRGGKCAFQ